MANIHSQKKRILRAERERLENRRYTSAIKTYFRRLEAPWQSGDAATADAEHRELSSTIDKAVKRGALHRNTGARKKSRAARIRAGVRRLSRRSSAVIRLDRAQRERVLVAAPRSASGCAPSSGAPPRESSSRSASAPSAARRRSGSAARDVGDEALGGARRHAQRRA